MKIDLTDRTAIVTGGTGNLGRMIVRTLASCGANVVVHYFRNKTKAEHLVEELIQRGTKATMVQADLTKLDSVMKLKDTVLQQVPEPEIIVTNAVVNISEKWTTVLEQSSEDYQSQFESCVLQNVFMAKAFVPGMIKRQYGRIVGINTEATMLCDPSMSAYVAGKRGMDGVLRVLAREIGRHQITVNQVAPGWTITDKVREEHSQRQEAYERRIPLCRRGTDQEVANVVAFLASDLASFITGAYIPVCGGTVMPTV